MGDVQLAACAEIHLQNLLSVIQLAAVWPGTTNDRFTHGLSGSLPSVVVMLLLEWTATLGKASTVPGFIGCTVAQVVWQRHGFINFSLSQNAPSTPLQCINSTGKTTNLTVAELHNVRQVM